MYKKNPHYNLSGHNHNMKYDIIYAYPTQSCIMYHILTKITGVLRV